MFRPPPRSPIRLLAPPLESPVMGLKLGRRRPAACDCRRPGAMQPRINPRDCRQARTALRSNRLKNQPDRASNSFEISLRWLGKTCRWKPSVTRSTRNCERSGSAMQHLGRAAKKVPGQLSKMERDKTCRPTLCHGGIRIIAQGRKRLCRASKKSIVGGEGSNLSTKERSSEGRKQEHTRNNRYQSAHD